MAHTLQHKIIRNTNKQTKNWTYKTDPCLCSICETQISVKHIYIIRMPSIQTTNI